LATGLLLYPLTPCTSEHVALLQCCQFGGCHNRCTAWSAIDHSSFQCYASASSQRSFYHWFTRSFPISIFAFCHHRSSSMQHPRLTFVSRNFFTSKRISEFIPSIIGSIPDDTLATRNTVQWRYHSFKHLQQEMQTQFTFGKG
jgi:hypothetical protein